MLKKVKSLCLDERVTKTTSKLVFFCFADFLQEFRTPVHPICMRRRGLAGTGEGTSQVWDALDNRLQSLDEGSAGDFVN